MQNTFGRRGFVVMIKIITWHLDYGLFACLYIGTHPQSIGRTKEKPLALSLSLYSLVDFKLSWIYEDYLNTWSVRAICIISCCFPYILV